jgi:hypothetical protein
VTLAAAAAAAAAAVIWSLLRAAGYCDGASHQRRDLYRQSPYDSAILFLQTTAAAARWQVREGLLQQLQAAMASCCPSEAAAERQRKQRGLVDLEWRGLGTPVLKFEGGVEANSADGVQQQQADMGVGQKEKKKKKQKKRKHAAEPSAQQQQQDEAVQKAGGEQRGKPKKKRKENV